MTAHTWLKEAIGEDQWRKASTDVYRRRLADALGLRSPSTDGENLEFVKNALELGVVDGLLDAARPDDLRAVAADVFGIARTLAWPEHQVKRAEWLVRLGCFAALGDRLVDFRRIVTENELPEPSPESAEWGIQVRSTVMHVWLRLLRIGGWSDLDAIQDRINYIRSAQRTKEPAFLAEAEARMDAGLAWGLMTKYHLAKAAEILAAYAGKGSVNGRYDIRQQLEAQFDRAIGASARGQLVELEFFSRLLAKTARKMVGNSIWTVTRAVSSRVNQFVESLTDRDRGRPVFEMLPPQRRTLGEEGLLGSSHRSVVVTLPTSSGKTFIAQFRILQSLNQFDRECGWVAYLAPTRALVNRLAARLRRDFSPLGVVVENASPALEIDGLEAGMLSEADRGQQFRILVTTPEKLDLILRGGWEEKIDRPLTLVVVGEAHGLASKSRGLKLELLLATINRECRYAQFLLLAPCIRNGAEIARWLSPDSNKSIDIGVDWAPNDRVVAIARVEKGRKRGELSLFLNTRSTTRNTLAIPERISIGEPRPLGLPWYKVAKSPGKIAAITAHALHGRGTVAILADSPRSTWRIANQFEVEANKQTLVGDDLRHVQRFIAHEMGRDFPLAKLLEYGVGVHHAGMSEDTRALVEWLAEMDRLKVLVATTTIAQGMNFPVSGVVFTSHQYRLGTPPCRTDMPPEDFWNIAGRAGRLNQGDVGVVALAAKDDVKQEALERFLETSVGELNSTLIEMVQTAVASGSQLDLDRLSYQPNWSAFVQYLAHTYRQIGNHEQFAAEIEQVLRGTLGFQSLRKSHEGWAERLVQGVCSYAERIRGKPLSLVDATGFSWESVSALLTKLHNEKLTARVWSPELFAGRREDLRKMMGILLEVPELRDSLKEVTGGKRPDGKKLTRIVCAWVQGQPLHEMATEFFGQAGEDDAEDDSVDPVEAMTKCCRNIFGKLTQSASWGLSALQALTIGDGINELSSEEQRSLRNLPARVYYGVNSDEAVALRLLGVPRSAAAALADNLVVSADEPLHQIRLRLRQADFSVWTSALGEHGASYYRVWSITEGVS